MEDNKGNKEENPTSSGNEQTPPPQTGPVEPTTSHKSIPANVVPVPTTSTRPPRRKDTMEGHYIPEERLESYLEVPQSLIGQIFVPGKLLMGPGPSNCSNRTLDALGMKTLGHMHKEFFQIMDDIKLGLQYVFQTRNPWTIVISGPGHAGMEAALANVIEPEDTVLVGVNGLWGVRVADLVNRLGGVPIKMEKAIGLRFNLTDISEALEESRPKALFLIHGESSTGVLQNLEGIGDLCRSFDCLLIVDAVATIAGVPFYMDKWKIDVVYTCSQKAIGAPAGLSPISFGPRAVAKIKERETPIKSFVFDMNLLSVYWACNDNDIRTYHHTPPVQLYYGLREALSSVAGERLENSWRRHAAVTERLHNGLRALGLQFFVENEYDRLPTVTTVKIPPGIVEWKLILAHIMEKHMIEVAGGLGPTVGQVLRLGVMGYNAYPIKVDRTLAALKEGLEFAKLKGRL